MSDYIGVVTNTGQAKIAAAIGGAALNLTTIRVGDGNGAPITPNAAMTDLVRRVGAAYPIISSGRDPVNANHWRVTALIPVNDGPFDIREIGVWDGAGDMIAVAKHVLVEKRTPAQGAAVELLTDIVFPVSETAQVTVQVTPAAQISIFQMLRAGFTVVESATLANPPGAPVLGQTHVVPAGATSAWNGLAGYLVQWNGIVWVAVNVPAGFVVVDQSKGRYAGNRWLERTAAGWDAGLTRLLQRQPGNYAVAAGTPNSLTVTLDPAPADWADLIGVPLNVLLTATNTASATLAIAGLPTGKPILRPSGADLVKGDLSAGGILRAMFDGVAVRLAGMTQAQGQNVSMYGPGTYSFVPPAGVFWVRARGKAGSGGGGGTSFAANSIASAGAGGGYFDDIFPVTPGVPITLLVGAGGLGGVGGAAPQSGNAGGPTSFGALATALGGGGGVAADGAIQMAGPAGGTASGARFAVPGNPGGLGYSIAGTFAHGPGGGAFAASNNFVQVTTGPNDGAAGIGCGGNGGALGGKGGKGGDGYLVIEY